IVRDRYDEVELAGFLAQPPEWFVIEPVDEYLVELFCQVSSDVEVTSGQIRPVEWADALHIATALARGEECWLAATDGVIQGVTAVSSRLI
ncbi:MAG: hypothetical protein KDI55_25495, partial [Anaerolineae bacterium]|nr:hypothetical protein [Anaerolineae bacterium]